ncbi:HalD/BesD family halogenase [Candidatus Pelagibacter sp.]|uniref:HalD/BesD family halogenase n=1 Tax=Candidatus Pelagibacter sp. TaxID=2024849 RepID=UPI003F86719B
MKKLENIINLNEYPINQTNSDEYKKLIDKNKKLLDQDGCCVLPNFIKTQSLFKMKEEVERNLNKIYWTKDSHNPYFTKDDPELSKDHPKRIFTFRESGYLNSDDLETDSDLDTLYESDEMLKFVSDSLGVYPLYKWADPLGKNPYSVMHEDHYFPWHFDGNEFTLSILIQKADKGGLFEYSQDLRNENNENFDEVTKVLRGDRKTVKSLDLKPGDLQIFKGRFSMHRVTKIEGKTSRYIALPTYVKDPYRVNKPEHSKQVYGKALPIHFERNNTKVDGLID